MRKYLLILVFILFASGLMAKGLRYSVCQVIPEYTEEEKSTLGTMAIIVSREGLSGEAHYLQTLTHPGYYGSGVIVDGDGAPRLLTTRQVVGYAAHVTVIVYLHDKTLRYHSCPVVGSDVETDIAIVALPDNDELEVLPLYDGDVEDGLEISTAGFALLNEQATWQLARGMVSNSQLQFGGHDYVQHTAPFNPGTSGGPVLVKTADGYRVVGISVSSMRRRSEVALAITLSDLKRTLERSVSGADAVLINDNADLHLFDGLSQTGWGDIKRHLTEVELDEMRSSDVLMPLDPIVEIMKKKGYYEQRTEQDRQVKLSRRGVTADISSRKQQFFYHNFLSTDNQDVGINMEFAFGKRKMTFIGFQFACSFMQAKPIALHPYGGQWGYLYYKLYDPKPMFSPLFGMYVGYQLPIRLAPKHVLIPRISQGGNIGPTMNRYDEAEDKYSVGTLLITSDSRFGIEYHYQMQKIAWIVGLDYTARVSATKADVVHRYSDGHLESIDAQTMLLPTSKHGLYRCFLHGVGLHFAIGF